MKTVSTMLVMLAASGALHGQVSPPQSDEAPERQFLATSVTPYSPASADSVTLFGVPGDRNLALTPLIQQNNDFSRGYELGSALGMIAGAVAGIAIAGVRACPGTCESDGVKVFWTIGNAAWLAAHGAAGALAGGLTGGVIGNALDPGPGIKIRF